MTYKLFYCCCDVTEKTAYLFINILDVIIALNDTLSGFNSNEKAGGIVSILWVISAVGSLIVYLVQNSYKTTLHYVYMFLRLFFVIFNLIMVIITLILVLANSDQIDPNQRGSIIIGCTIVIISSLYQLYLSCLLKRIVANN